MLFSTLIDADRLATEAFFNPARAAERNRAKPSIPELQAALERYLEQEFASAEPTSVNRIRAEVLKHCLAASRLEPGFFSLTVPTGGGKTYSSLAFALRHASAHGLRRVVVVEPFTTIIEQTAEAYRKALGALAERGLVEHHSDIEPARDTLDNRLATENWDAPLIVTTSVQLYESLFASRTAPCRKLHRLARSVIVLDEAQTLPVEFLHPTLLALQELVAHYGCSVVLCTATQPALHRREDFPIGIDPACVRAIVPDADRFFTAFRRVQVRRLGKLADEELVQRLADHHAVLCVVNSRPHAARLYDLLVRCCPKESCFHLSRWMCAQHRRDMLATIQKRLKAGHPCRLVSTQLIEAGVDIDFPVVYRAPAGFDSVAQSAGRCNREGKLPEGIVYLFDTESLPPAGFLRQAAQVGRELAESFESPLSPDAIEAYFRLFYWSQQHRWDEYQVLAQFNGSLRNRELLLQFREASTRYKIIREQELPILVPYDAQARAIRETLLRSERVDSDFLRSAQRYLVPVFKTLLQKLVERSLVIEHPSGIWVLTNDDSYSKEKGLSAAGAGIDPQLLME